MVVTGAQDALAGLRRWQLERDDESDPGGRIYKDSAGTIYHSVTRVLAATAPAEQQAALQRWLERPGSEADRTLAAERGTLTHSHAEYLLKTANKLVRNTANRRGLWQLRCTACGGTANSQRWNDSHKCPRCGAVGASDGLERAPKAITAWAMEKAIQGAPSPSWSASGFARGLRHWIAEHITAIHAVEFSVHSHHGFAGSADALADVDGVTTVCDWKTTKKSAHACMDTVLEGYRCQAAAYALGLKERTGIEVDQAAIVLARRTGAPSVTLVRGQELRDAEQRFLERCARYFDSLTAVS